MKPLFFSFLFCSLIGNTAQAQIDCSQYKTYLDKAKNENDAQKALEYCTQAQTILTSCLAQYNAANQAVEATRAVILAKQAAEKSKEVAQQQLAKAQLETQTRYKKQIAVLGEKIALKSLGLENPEITGLLAKEAYEIYKDSSNLPSPHIYKALYKAISHLQYAKENKKFNALDQKPREVKELGAIRSICISKDNKYIYTTGSKGFLLQWDFKTMTYQERYKQANLPKILQSKATIYRTLAISPNGQFLAQAGDTKGIEIFDLSNPSQAPQIIETLNNRRIWKVLFAQDNKTLFFLGDDRYIYTSILGEGKGKAVIGDSIPFSPKNMTISADNQYIIVYGSSTKAIIYHLPTGRKHLELEDFRPEAANKEITAIAIDPKDKFIVLGYQDGGIAIWNLEENNLDNPPERKTHHKAIINELVFSADGRKMAAGSLDGTATLWTFEHQGKYPFNNPFYEPIKLEDHNNWVLSLAFNTDGSQLVTGTGDGVLKIWETDMRVYSDMICPLINKNLSNYDWRKYIGTDDYKNENNLFIQAVDGSIRTPNQTCTCNNVPCKQMPEK